MEGKEGGNMRILIVEDHPKIRNLLALFAGQDGHQAETAESAESALERIATQTFEVILTDLMLPDMQGEDLIRKIREVSDVYIMVISAKIDLKDRLDALSLGADDYVTKPFSVEEVMAKLKNLGHRLQNERPLRRSYNHGRLEILPLQREVRAEGEAVVLTPHEFDLLWHLANHRKRIFSREELLEFCFGDSEAFDRVIDVHVKNIRKKINDDPTTPRYIKTHYGVGYQFVGDPDDQL